MENSRKYLIYTHIAIAMFGSASLFGKLVHQPALVIVAGRVFFSALALGIFFAFKRISVKMESRKDYILMLLLGVILAAHWICFYRSIQDSTVAIALLTFSTCPIFTTFIEPFFFRQRIRIRDIFTALATCAGVLFVVPKGDISGGMLLGAVEGIFSGITFSFLSIIEKMCIVKYKGYVISFYEQFVAFFAVLPFVMVTGISGMTVMDLSMLVILALVFTLLSRTLFITGLKGISAQAAGVINSLEPLYGIVLAAVILDEIPSAGEIFGGIIILSTVMYSSFSTVRDSSNGLDAKG